MPRPTSHAIVNLAALDLRARPDHRSELCSQLWMGEVVRVEGTSRDRRWLKVRNGSDGYVGWTRRWGLVETGRSGAAAWLARARARVLESHLVARAKPDGEHVTPLFLNARVVPRRRIADAREIELPDARRAWVGAASLGSISRRTRSPIGDRVRSLMGVPYLWGGRTPMGLDCSALTQIVLFERGVALPRDAHQQFRAARALAAGEARRPGDLIFFGVRRRRADHVGVLVEEGGYAHARGCVRLNSDDPENPMYDNELGNQVIGYGRAGREGEGG